jgi:transcriptional regulator NrdR family protein
VSVDKNLTPAKVGVFYPPTSIYFTLAFSIAIYQYIVMVCIYCGGLTTIINSRQQRRLNRKWRRRKCQTCGQIFTTIESIPENNSFMIKRSPDDPRLQPFSRDKLFVSIYRSCEYRPTALSDAGSLTDTVISQLQSKVENSCIPLSIIQQQASITLKRFDPVAAMFYKAYYNR